MQRKQRRLSVSFVFAYAKCWFSHDDSNVLWRIKEKKIILKSNRKAMNRNWSNQKANPALKTKNSHKKIDIQLSVSRLTYT